jgi:sigma-B regulation protein RsbU (phosphoserine phosphatase)
VVAGAVLGEADGPRPDLRPVPGLPGYYYEILGAPPDTPRLRSLLEPVLGAFLTGERESLRLAQELADRYAEIELLYSISETLGRARRLDAAAEQIVREVGQVFGCRRTSILVYDAGTHHLRPVAGWGIDVSAFPQVDVNDPCSIAAQVFREGRTIGHDATDPNPLPQECAPERRYRGEAFLSLPIVYPQPGGTPRPIGVLNLTERHGTDVFSASDKKLIAAIANQIGAALENARLVEQDLARQGLQRELELARDLQRKLLGPPAADHADVAARCLPAASVGGDFYHVIRLRDDALGVMLGDVSSHGFAAALIMALVLSAAGIHAATTEAPAEVLQRLLDSVAGELEETEMYLSLFYGVADRKARRLRYANAGHPHAFRIDRNGAVRRLEATTPPLGLAPLDRIAAAEIPWKKGDVLLLFSDGLVDGRSGGTAAGERAIVRLAATLRQRPAQVIVDAVLEQAGAEPAADDRTILVLKA